jgi:Designed helical repeat protein 10 domain
MQKSVKTDKRNVTLAERKVRELRARGVAMDVVLEELNDNLELLGRGESVKKKYEEGVKGYEGLKDGCEGKKRVMRDLELKAQVLSRV